MKRREFIKAAAIAAAACSVSAQASAAEETSPLSGVFDMHVHAGPDVVPRKVDAFDLAAECKRRGYGGLVLKCHFFNTNEWAYMIRKAIPGIEVFGSITLNNSYGGRLNVFAVKQALSMTDQLCKCVWLPTQNADQHMKSLGKKGIPVVDENGKVVPEIIQLMELCAEKDIILATGHSAAHEMVAIARKAREVGFKKLVMTHCSSQIEVVFTADQAKECLECGAWLEHSALNYYNAKNYDREAHVRRIAEYISFDPSHQFVDTDLGNAKCPHPCDGMLEFMGLLKNAGLSDETLRMVTHTVPAKLLNLEKA